MKFKNENLFLLISLVLMVILLMNIFSSPPAKRSDEMIFSNFVHHVQEGEVIEATIFGKYRVEGKLLDGGNFASNIPPETDYVVDLLRDNKVKFEYIPDSGTPWYITTLIQWGPFIFLLLLWVFLMRRMQGGAGGKLFNIGKSKAQRADPNRKKVTFDDVAGVEEAKEELVEIIEYLKDPAKFRKLGGRIPKGVLMSGPPGTGKTLLAKAVAGEAEVPFFSISGSDFVEMFVGVGASRVRDLFDEGRKNSPCIVFIDEIDAVGRSRGSGLGGGNDEREQTLNQLLVEMDGFDASEGLIVIAATNRPDVLDPALLRPGRFDRQVHVSHPDVRGREMILNIYIKKVVVEQGIDVKIIAKRTPGFSGADLRNLVNEAALLAARKNKKALTLDDFDQARDKIMMGPERESMVMSEKERRSTAYHEAGHALVSVLLPKTDPVHKVTIVPRGRALGVTSYLPEHDHRTYDKDYLTDKVTIAMGGRAAEELIFDELTTGAGNDIEQATNVVRNMICRFGMSEILGPVVLETDDQRHVFGRDIGKDREYSESTASSIDNEIRTVVKFHYNKAITLLRDNIEVLHTIARVLLEEETIDGSRIKSLLNPQSDSPDSTPA